MYDLTQPRNADIPRFPGDPEVHMPQAAVWETGTIGTPAGLRRVSRFN
jgi:kynurenine formamidase